jgi:hypothetical protein
VLYGEGSRRPTTGLRRRGSVVTLNGYPVIRAESPLAIDGVGAFQLLGGRGGYEVGALVGLRGPIIGRGNVELGDGFRLPREVWRSFHVEFYYSRIMAHRRSYGVFLIAQYESVVTDVRAGGEEKFVPNALQMFQSGMKHGKLSTAPTLSANVHELFCS